jgi:hypothetical protein
MVISYIFRCGLVLHWQPEQPVRFCDLFGFMVQAHHKVGQMQLSKMKCPVQQLLNVGWSCVGKCGKYRGLAIQLIEALWASIAWLELQQSTQEVPSPRVLQKSQLFGCITKSCHSDNTESIITPLDLGAAAAAQGHSLLVGTDACASGWMAASSW